MQNSNHCSYRYGALNRYCAPDWWRYAGTGDIRATDCRPARNQTVARLMQGIVLMVRECPELNGMAMGNLMLAALYRESWRFWLSRGNHG
jgi:hypothetical protein